MNPLTVIFLVGTAIALVAVLAGRWMDLATGEKTDAPVALYTVVFLVTLALAGTELYAYIVIPNYCEGLTIWDLEYWARGCFGMPN
jgi:cytochrome bd-type quinol oxidase subunit 2